LSVYLDASVLVALFTNDFFTARADAYLRGANPILIVSDFAAAEFASSVARSVRTKAISPDEARQIFANFDAWLIRTTPREPTTTQDIAAAEAYLRRLDLTLRTPDAVNIAIAQRFDATLATFDEKMGVCARMLGTPTAYL
jgi:predicted nucleic acid-binding protein